MTAPFQGFGSGTVLVSRDEGVWSISDRDGVEVIQVAGQTSLTEGDDYFFV